MGLLSALGGIAKTVIGTVTGGLGNAIGSSITGAAGSALGNYLDEKAQKRVATHGAKLDRQSAIDQYTDRYDFLRGEGATITEAMGVGTGSTAQGATQTLGNSAAQLRAQRIQEQSAARERALDRQTDLAKTAIAADAQVTSAKTAADASMHNVDQQIDWERDSKLLSMGLENVLSTLELQRFGIDPTDPMSVTALTDEEWQKVKSTILANTSVKSKDAEAVISLGERFRNWVTAYEKPTGGTKITPIEPPPGGYGRFSMQPPAMLGNQGISEGAFDSGI